jgi:hypothetical protein
MSTALLQPGQVVQVAYIVRDLEESIGNFARELNLGGWLMIENLSLTELVYRGKPGKLNVSLALAYSGEMLVELIQQHDDAPSVYTEVINTTGYGFHHLAMAVPSLDNSIREYEGKGYELAMKLSNGVSRGAYMDTRRTLPGMLELIEVSEAMRDLFGMAYRLKQDLAPNGPSIQRMPARV